MANILNPELVVARKNAVIQALKEGHAYTKALKIAGLNPRSAAQWRETDLAFEEAIQKHLQYDPRAVHNQKRLPTRAAKDVKPEERGDVIDQLCAELEDCIPLEIALCTVNLGKEALRKFMADDPSVAARVNRSKAKGWSDVVRNIKRASEGDWKAGMALLERIIPHLFGEVKAVEMNVRTETAGGDPISPGYIDVTPELVVQRLSAMSDTELEAIIAKEHA